MPPSVRVVYLAALCLTALLVVPTKSASASVPRVALDNGTFVGFNNGSTDIFLGIPFAKPPVGNLRFRLPLANEPYRGIHNATTPGTPCVQQKLKVDIPDILASDAKAFAEAYLQLVDFEGGEDCLTVNVWKPADTPVEAKLPVVVYFYGGGFEVGESMDGRTIVQRSIALGEPVVYVNLNYRLSALGWLGGTEVQAAGVGNIGLHDQREALRWVQKYISAFNGDPSRVTIWGQSAGAISVALQMLANDGDTEGLFHAAFMESGAAIPVGDMKNGQKVYDAFVRDVGCQNAKDTLQCLRDAPFAAIKKAMDDSASFLSPSALNLAWTPRADGTFLRELPQKALLEGKVANVPFISGNCDDEGTIFSLALTNITTNDEFRGYIHSNYFPKASPSELDRLLKAYPSDVTVGSPFNTGTQNAVTPQYKRLAALQGDLTFFAPRRLFLQSLASRQDAWVYLWKKGKALEDLGSAHGFDLDDIYGPGDLTDYVINLFNHGNPNARNGTKTLHWPRYTLHNPQLLTLRDGAVPIGVGRDDFREEAIRVMTELSLKYPL